MQSNMEKGDMVIKAHWEGTGSNTRLYLAVEGVPDILQKMFFGMMQGLGIVPTQIEGLEEPQSMDLTEEREETIALITEADLKDVEESIRLMEQKEDIAKDLKQEAEMKSVVSNDNLNTESEKKEPSKEVVQKSKKESAETESSLQREAESVSSTTEVRSEIANTYAETPVDNGNITLAGNNVPTEENVTASVTKVTEVKDEKVANNFTSGAETKPDKEHKDSESVPVEENKASVKYRENVEQQNKDKERKSGMENIGKQNNTGSNTDVASQKNNGYGNGNYYKGNHEKNVNSGKSNNPNSHDGKPQPYQKPDQNKNSYKSRADQLGPQSSGNHKIMDGEYKGMTAEEAIKKHRLNAVAHFYRERKQKYYGGAMKREIKAAVQKYIDTITGSMANPDKAMPWLITNYSEVTAQELKKMRYGNTPEEHMRFANTESMDVKVTMVKTLFNRLVKEI